VEVIKIKIIIGADHAGYELKEQLKKSLEKDYGVEDISQEFNPKDDYPDIAEKVGKRVVELNARGIMICGSGTGSAIAANKVKGVRAAPLHTEELVYLARLHNDINVLCLKGLEFEKPITEIAKSGKYESLLDIPSKTADMEKAKKLVKIFLETGFEAGRHKRRTDKISKIEQCNS